MKNLIISMLAVAAMVSCTSENDPIDEINPTGNNKVEIKLTAGVIGVETRAALLAWDNSQVKYAVKQNAESSYEDWYSTITGTTVTFTGNDFSTGATHYYNSDNSNTTLVGYYPASGTLATNNITFEIPADGQDDIMASAIMQGNKATNFGNIEFKHLLAKLSFKIKKGDGFTTAGNVTKIVLKGTKRSATLSLADPTSLTFASLAAGDDINVYEDNTGAVLGNDVSDVRTVMVQPGATMKIDVTVGGQTFSDIPVTIAGDAQKGSGYNVTLTFSGSTISTQASIAEWNNVAGDNETPVQ